MKKNVLYVSTRQSDVRALVYKARQVWNISTLADPRTAPIEIESRPYDFILFDLSLTGVFSPDLLRRVTAVARHPPVFILSREQCFAFVRMALSAGVCGYFQIPCSTAALIRQIHWCLEAGDMSAAPLSGEINPETLLHSILGKSALMERLRSDIFAFRHRTESVLIFGETGSGKDLVARMIHANSPVASGPYIALNVSCIASTLAESILFGTHKGCYTGALENPGLFEDADRGTLFLDEVSELDLALQPKFLRVLEDKQVSRIGSSVSRKVEFRLICATNKSLAASIEARQFREDLFHRLDILRIEIPPLRKHREDIPLLASFKLRGYRKMLSLSALEKLHGYRWPGNVRQLFNCLVRAACLAEGDVIYPDHIRF